MRVLSLNTWGVNGPPERRAVLVKAIRDLQPDIALLQEVADPSLLPELGLPTHVHAPEGALAVATRFPAIRYGSVLYQTVSPLENNPRQLLLTQLDTGEGPLWAGCTHLSWKPDDAATRLAQTEELIRLVSALPEPVLLGGDFNASPGEPPIHRVKESGYADLHEAIHPGEPGTTWDNRNPFIQSHRVQFPDRRIDYLFLRGKALRPASCEVVCAGPGSGGLHPSDHYGVLAILER